MTIFINETIHGEHGTYVTATCGKVSATVSVHAWGFQVCCMNAAHRVFRKMGRHFATLEAALLKYRSPEMQAIILAADHEAKNPGAA